MNPEKIRNKILAIPVFEKFDQFNVSLLPPGFEQQLEIIKNPEDSDFKGKLSEMLTLYSSLGPGTIHPLRIIFVGMGKIKDYSEDNVRMAFGSLGSYCCEKQFNSIGIIVPDKKLRRLPPRENLYRSASVIVEGLNLGAYRFDMYKSKKDKKNFKFESVTFILRSSRDAPTFRKASDLGLLNAKIAAIARDLTNMPPNDLSPAELAKRSKEIAGKVGAKTQVLNMPALMKSKLNGIIAVGKGSENPPNMIIIDHDPNSKKKIKKKIPTIVLVGKAVCFDSGGISLKPGLNMDRMKTDMAGGAAVIAGIAGLAEFGVPVRAVGLVPAVENLPSGSATKPGDIIRYANGKTAEILNTDAEGRLILADALTYAERYNPDIVVDIATLTGACVVALGQHAAGLMGNNDKLLTIIENVSKRTGEKVWRLPLWESYRDEMKGMQADIKNVASREGGAINAAGFLQEFADNYHWAHIDIAGMAWTDKGSPLNPKGATGFGSRLLFELGRTIGGKKIVF